MRASVKLALSSPLLRYSLIALAGCCSGFAQQTVTLSLSSGSAPPGAVCYLEPLIEWLDW